MKVIQPPHQRKSYGNTTIFLGGSIEMGKAGRWQDKLINQFKNEPVTFWNPRRDDWDSSWEQDPTPGTEFHTQVIWELDAQDEADILVYYFDPETKAPITLLELGAHKDENTVVACPDGYFRKGNVVIFCRKYNIPVLNSLSELVNVLKKSLKGK